MFTRAYGLADFFGPEFNNATKDRFVSNAAYFDFVSRLPPSFAPGERNQYCNGCYIALGYTRREGDGTLRSNLAMHGVTGLGIAGGAPGTNATLEAWSEWVVVVLSNFDPPTAERIGTALANALAR